MNKKNDFVFGLVSGIAIIATIGFIGVIAIANNNNSQVKDSIAVDNAPTKVQPTPTPTPPPTPNVAPTVNIKVKSGEYVRGNKNAKNTIIEYSDFQCPYCSRFHTSVSQLLEKYPNDVKWVYRHFPLSFHPYAKKAAEASECAGDQGKFWEYTDKLYENQKSINSDYLVNLAKELKLDSTKFEGCLTTGKYTDKVNNDFKEGQGFGVTGTPGSFLNGQKLKGAVPFQQLEQMLLSQN